MPDSAVWRLDRPAVGVVEIDYTVDLSFANAPWPYGNEQAALYTEAASSPSPRYCSSPAPRRVEFWLPAGWHVAAPWPQVPGAPGRYDVRDRNSLIDNSLVLGPVSSTTIQAGAFTFHLALLGPAAAGRSDVEGALGAVVREFVRIFPRLRPPST